MSLIHQALVQSQMQSQIFLYIIIQEKAQETKFKLQSLKYKCFITKAQIKQYISKDIVQGIKKMKVSEKGQKQLKNPYQEQLQQFLSLKPSRAVQRLLQQNAIQNSLNFYNFLQYILINPKDKQQNPTQINFVQSCIKIIKTCINVVRRFTKYKDVQMDIDRLMNKELEKDQFKRCTQTDDVVLNIQLLMCKHQFYQALKLCGKSQVFSGFQQEQYTLSEDLYYLKFLKVEIIQSLEQSLQNSSLNEDIIDKSIKTLKQFVRITTFNEYSEIIQQCESSSSVELPLNISNQNSIIVLIYEKLQQKLKADSEQIGQTQLDRNELIQIIFRFKLLSLQKNQFNLAYQNQQQRIVYIQTEIKNFFNDLLKLLKESPNNKLSGIFDKNIQKLMSFISQLFMINQKKINIRQSTQIDQKNSQGVMIRFENQLYQSLINSNQFISILKDLSHELNADENVPIDLLSLIKNLWKDFYHQLLDIVCEKANPFSNFIINDKHLARSILPQLARFQNTRFGKLSQQAISQQKVEITSMFLNLNSLLQKSKPNQKDEIFAYYCQLKDQQQTRILNELRKSQQSNQTQIDEKHLHQLILLFLLTQQYNINWKAPSHTSLACLYQSIQNSNLNPHQLCMKNFDLQKHELINKIINCYIKNMLKKKKIINIAHSYIDDWQVQLDFIFAIYNRNVLNDQDLNQSLKKLILFIIKDKMHDIQ